MSHSASEQVHKRPARKNVAGIILAAGQSSRLGRPKQLLELDGRPILDIVLENAGKTQLGQIVLVLGHQAERISAAVGGHGHDIVINPDFALGQSTSLRSGLLALDERVDAALVLLGDQPLVSATTIEMLLNASAANPAAIVQPLYSGVPGNPVLFRRSIFADLIAIDGDRGAREIIRRNQDAVLRVPFPGLTPPLDVDTDEDYDILRAAWAGGASNRR